jgi:hypothetical protein
MRAEASALSRALDSEVDDRCLKFIISRHAIT